MKKIFILLLFILFVINLYAQKQGQERIDSLLVVLSTDSANGKLNESNADTNTVSLLIDLSYEYYSVNPDAGIYYGNRAMELAKKLNWQRGIAVAGNKIGLNYWAKAEYPKALEYQMNALALSEKIHDKKSVATILGNIGLVYERQELYDKALKYHFDALKLNEEMDDKSAIARNLGNIGNAYDAQGVYTKSIEYYNKALKIYGILGEKDGEARNLGNIGFVYQEQKNYLKALEYDFKALDMNRQLGNKILGAINQGNIGETYFSIAKENTGNALHLPDSLKPSAAIPKAKLYLKMSIDFFAGIDDRNSLQELYLYLSDLESLSGNYKESLLAYRQHVASRDSVFNAENKEKIERIEKNREEDLKQKEIELLKSQNEVQRLTSQRVKAVTIGLGALLIGIIFIATVFYNQNRKTKKMNAQLQEAYTDLKNTQQQLVKSERMAAFGLMASRVAHEIQNPINFVNNFSEVAVELLHDIVEAPGEKERKEAIATLKDDLEKIIRHGKRADDIVKQLLEHTREGRAHEFFEPDKT